MYCNVFLTLRQRLHNRLLGRFKNTIPHNKKGESGDRYSKSLSSQLVSITESELDPKLSSFVIISQHDVEVIDAIDLCSFDIHFINSLICAKDLIYKSDCLSLDRTTTKWKKTCLTSNISKEFAIRLNLYNLISMPPFCCYALSHASWNVLSTRVLWYMFVFAVVVDTTCQHHFK